MSFQGASRLRLMFSYGLGDAGTGLAASQLGFYLFVFFTCTAGLEPFVAGSLLMLIKVWDGINDPLIGWLSDHTNSRWGPRLPWMIAASAPLGISLAAIWWVPPLEEKSKIIYYALMAILLMSAYTGVNLPYAALSTELTSNTNTRTRLNAARFTGSIIASLTGLLVAWWLTRFGESGYIAMGRITGSIATLTTLLCCWGLAPYTKKAQRPKLHSESVLKQLKRIFQNNMFLKVLSLYFLLWCGLQLMQTVALIYLVQVIQVPPSYATFGLILFQLSALAGLQVWSFCSNRYGRIQSLYLGGSLWIGSCILSMMLEPISVKVGINNVIHSNEIFGIKTLLLSIIILSVGFGASTAYLIPWSLLPDAIDNDPEHPAGFYTAWMILIQKVGIGLSMGLLGLLLSVSGYISASQCSGAITYIKQPIQAITSIRFCMGLIPALLVTCGLLIMRNWPEKGEHLQQRNT